MHLSDALRKTGSLVWDPLACQALLPGSFFFPRSVPIWAEGMSINSHKSTLVLESIILQQKQLTHSAKKEAFKNYNSHTVKWTM